MKCKTGTVPEPLYAPRSRAASNITIDTILAKACHCLLLLDHACRCAVPTASSDHLQSFSGSRIAGQSTTRGQIISSCSSEACQREAEAIRKPIPKDKSTILSRLSLSPLSTLRDGETH